MAWVGDHEIRYADYSQTGTNEYQYLDVVMAFGHEGTVYVAFNGCGAYRTFRLFANDGTGWQLAHSSAVLSTLFGGMLWNDPAVNPVSGMPVFAFGLDPIRIVERIPPAPGVSVEPTEGLVTTEEGKGTDTFAVRLDTGPAANVTIDLSSSDTSEGTVSPTSLTLTPSNWKTVQMVTVTGVDDSAVDGDVAYTIITTDTESTDSSYDGLPVDDVSVTNLDDDAAATCHVGDLDGAATSNKNRWTATITILILDDASNPVADALVSGSWIAGASGTASCTTDSSGLCTVTSSNVSKNVGAITFTVTDVTHADFTYNSADNSDPDGDSDGTTITVNKP